VIAACYHRNSTAGQIGNYSQQEAERRLPQLARAHGFAQVEFHLEAGVSGEELHNRPVLQSLLNRIGRGEIGALVCQDHTRLARDRDLIDGQLIKQVCRRAGCLIIDEQKVYDLRLDADDLTSDVQFLGAKIQKRQNLRGIVRGLEEEARQTGMVTRRREMFGYDRRTELVDGKARRVQSINPREAEIVRRMYELVLDHGIREVASILNADRRSWRSVKERKQQVRIAARYGGDGTRRPWWAQDVREICTNPLYRGVALWAKPESIRRGQRPRSDLMAHVNNVTVEHPELAIVGSDLWFRAQQAQENRSARYSSRAIRSSYLYSGILRCPKCNGTMHGYHATHNRHGLRLPTYRCTQWAARGKAVCAGLNIRERAVSAGVFPYLASLLPQREIEQAIAHTLSRDGSSELERRQRARHTQAIVEVQRRLENLRLSLEVTSDREEHVRKEARIARLKEEIAAHRDALARLDLRRADHRSSATVLETLGKIADVTMLDDLARLQPQLLQQLLRAVFQSLAVMGFHVGRRYSCRVVAVEYTDSFALLMTAANGQDAAGIIAAGDQLPRLVLSAS
jgi:site-specific DNA recombinase